MRCSAFQDLLALLGASNLLQGERGLGIYPFPCSGGWEVFEQPNLEKLQKMWNGAKNDEASKSHVLLPVHKKGKLKQFHLPCE